MKGRESDMRDGGTIWTLSAMTQKIEKNKNKNIAYICFGKDDKLTDKEIEVSSWGTFSRDIFLLIGETSLFIHTRGLIQG